MSEEAKEIKYGRSIYNITVAAPEATLNINSIFYNINPRRPIVPIPADDVKRENTDFFDGYQYLSRASAITLQERFEKLLAEREQEERQPPNTDCCARCVVS